MAIIHLDLAKPFLNCIHVLDKLYTIMELERPIKPEKLSDWAFSQFIDIKRTDPDYTEREIALLIFSKEYLKTNVPDQFKELALKNINGIDGIPDVILAILNMEAENGRGAEELDVLFVTAMIYSMKTYQSKVGKDTKLYMISIVFGLIYKMVEIKVSDSKRRTTMIYELFNKIVGWGVYKSFKTFEEASDYIDKVIKGL